MLELMVVSLLLVLFSLMKVRLIYMFFALVISVLIMLKYMYSSLDMLMVGSMFLWDLLSFLLILLSIWVTLLMVVASMSSDMKENSSYNFYMLAMLVLLIMAFSVNNLVGFYLFFESVLIPIMVMIFKWGNQPERLQAGKYMLLYTLFGSLPLLIILLNLSYMNSVCWYFLQMSYISLGSMEEFLLIFAFLVKMPMYLVHFWLPKAHVEAPVAGSMILAGVLLKLGGYGILRVFIMFDMCMFNYFSWMVMSVALVGAFYVGFVCLRQVDVKSLVAYSSVCHMSLVIGGLVSGGIWGSMGALILMLGHGLCSSGLFCVANMVYERFFTRNLLMLKGLMLFFPSMTLWWFLLSVVNMGAPPSMNLLGEIFLMGSIIKWSFMSILFLMLLSFVSACYSLYLFSYSQHGKSWFSFSVISFEKREYILMYSHFFPLGLYILKSELFTFWI